MYTEDKKSRFAKLGTLSTPGKYNHIIGGWGEIEGEDAFVRYATFCFENLGDIVPYWVTIQEIQRELLFSYELGITPPMIPIGLPGRKVYKVAKHMLMAHAS
jgi:beta-glucosidase/6-phospho-beta-glucosidase/beta-galactosidase